MLRGRLFAMIVGALVTFGVGNAAAATITVTTTSDDSSAGDGLCSLREAIADVDAPGSNGGDCAPAAFGSNTIVLGPHTYFLTRPDSSSASALQISSTVTNLTISGAGESATRIDAGGAGVRVLDVAAGASANLSDLTLTGGSAPDGDIGVPATGDVTGGAGGPGASGGAVLNQGSLSLGDVAVTGSTAGNGGSGGAGGAGAGGAVGGAGGPGGAGGGIYNTGGLTLAGVTLSGDQAGNGGAGGGGGSGSAGDGGAGGGAGAGGDGGAISNAGTLTVLQSTINGDSSGAGGIGGSGGQGSSTAGAAGGAGAGGVGGGISTSGGSLDVVNSTFASDSAGSGGLGGAGAEGGSGGAGGGGGGVSVAGSTASLRNVTMAGDDAGGVGPAGTGPVAGSPGAAGTGGGVLVQGPATALQNVLLYLDGGGNCSGSIIDAGNNLSFGGSGCPATFSGGYPDLGPLQDNGGPAKTISLQPGSAAIDRVPSTGAGCPATDERGVPRPSGKACDIGAYEVAPPKATTDAPAVVSERTATLAARVVANSGGSSVWFEYGRSSKYGSKTRVQTVLGVSPIAVSAKLGALKANTRYHYRVRIVSPDGTAMGADHTFVTSRTPALGSLKLRPASFRVAGRGPRVTGGTTITYTDSQKARTRLTVLVLRAGVRSRGRCVAAPKHGAGSRKGCKRYVAIGSFTHSDAAGRNRVRFSGRVGARALGPNQYKLEATPRAHGRDGATVSAMFRVLR